MGRLAFQRPVTRTALTRFQSPPGGLYLRTVVRDARGRWGLQGALRKRWSGQKKRGWTLSVAPPGGTVSTSADRNPQSTGSSHARLRATSQVSLDHPERVVRKAATPYTVPQSTQASVLRAYVIDGQVHRVATSRASIPN